MLVLAGGPSLGNVSTLGQPSSSLGQNFVSGGMEHCDDMGPAQTMIGEKSTTGISTGTRAPGSATNDKELAAGRVGITGRILGRWMYRSKQSSPELDVAEAERLEKDLKVEDISKSLKDVLLVRVLGPNGSSTYNLKLRGHICQRTSDSC